MNKNENDKSSDKIYKDYKMDRVCKYDIMIWIDIEFINPLVVASTIYFDNCLNMLWQISLLPKEHED